MTPEMARERRGQMVRDGYCVIPDILSPEFLLELGQESDRLNDTMEHHPDTKYQDTPGYPLRRQCNHAAFS